MVLTKFLNSKLETKYRWWVPESLTGGFTLLADQKFDQAISGTSDCFQLMPRISQGLGVSERIGEDISPISLKLMLGISLVVPTFKVGSYASLPPPTYGTVMSGPEDITVHIFILKSRVFPDFHSSSQINIGADLMCEYNGQQQQKFTGDYWSTRLQVNTEKYNVIRHIKLRMRKAAGYYSYVKNVSEGGNYDPATNVENVSTNMGSHTMNLSIRVPVPRKLTYQQANYSMPENYNPFMCAGWTANEYPLTPLLPTTFYPLSMTGRVLFKYKDA